MRREATGQIETFGRTMLGGFPTYYIRSLRHRTIVACSIRYTRRRYFTHSWSVHHHLTSVVVSYALAEHFDLIA